MWQRPTTTDADGNYIFDGLAAGAYVVKVTATPPAGYTQTGDPDYSGRLHDMRQPHHHADRAGAGRCVRERRLRLPADRRHAARSATRSGSTPTATTARTRGEPGIPGVTVALIKDLNGNGVWDAGEPIIATDITDANGQYRFTGLPTTASR